MGEKTLDTYDYSDDLPGFRYSSLEFLLEIQKSRESETG